ncbi:hypothetical protein ACFPTO_06590 [Paraburkholderia denitrificans]|uniref:Uncharacterized protein n=1 Tax=Paraburkholderia denitrificans TaxID=694025 RepID=A0ABW0J625_9BURK
MGLLGKLLSKQDAEFISLDELLDQMTSEAGGSRVEAATFLARLLTECDGFDVEGNATYRGPAWYRMDKEFGWELTPSRYFDAPRKKLMTIVKPRG